MSQAIPFLVSFLERFEYPSRLIDSTYLPLPPQAELPSRTWRLVPMWILKVCPRCLGSLPYAANVTSQTSNIRLRHKRCIARIAPSVLTLL